ncbi:MAG: polyhydroxyalkanoate depolymerase [Alphaproteobacteria bacterium]|nr:polyhydroxyalkanoate depolymerase [Alphaproteobacteria bacterium]
MHGQGFDNGLCLLNLKNSRYLVAQKPRHNPLLYPAIEARRVGLKATFNTMAIGLEFQSAMVRMAEAFGAAPKAYTDLAKDVIKASKEMSERFARDYVKPEFDLPETKIDGKPVRVTEEIVNDKAFGSLLHFKRDTDRNDPKLLIVAPMSGHFATLLRDTVKEMLPNHDVYITDWKDAKGIPLSAGEFGLDEYIDYVKEFIKTVGKDAHVMAVCQPTVATMAAIASLAEEKSEFQPASMTLMAGPLDIREAETQVTKLAQSKPIEWFQDNLIGEVSANHAGAGRMVYPGFVQLFSFMSMNPDSHNKKHIDLFNDLIQGNDEKATKTKKFYDEYLAVADLPAKFYLETVEKVFIDPQLAKGTLEHHGKKVNPAAIKKTALFTVEGAEDDISAPGQTTVAHKLAAGLKPEQKFHHLQEGVGHYGTFSGRGWREGIAPRITGFIRDIAKKNGIEYAPASNAVKPEKWPENKLPPAAKPPKLAA